jgi:peptide/nickel transport system permease protein
VHRYIVRRLLAGVPTLIGISIIIFVAMRIMPGDVLAAMFGAEEGVVRLSEAERARAMAILGLDRPIYLQYLSWIKDIFQGRLGESFFRGQPVMDLLRHRAPVTAEIGVLAVLISWLVGLPVGILSAMRQDTLGDYAGRVVTILFLAAPAFWLGALYVMIAVIHFNWLPPTRVVQAWDDPIQNLSLVIGPAIVLGLGISAYIARMTRSSLLEIIREDYVRTARAKGLREGLIMSRHMLKNALLPVITLSGVTFGSLLGGSVAVEKAFNVQGLGLALVRAVNERDFGIIQNLVLMYGVVFLAVNLAVDLLYAWLDPRIRYD